MLTLPIRVIAASFGLTAFAVAVFAGLASGADAPQTLSRAILCMLACYLLGSLIGWTIRVAAQDHMAQFIAEHPLPQEDRRADQPEAAQSTHSAQSRADERDLTP